MDKKWYKVTEGSVTEIDCEEIMDITSADDFSEYTTVIVYASTPSEALDWANKYDEVQPDNIFCQDCQEVHVALGTVG